MNIFGPKKDKVKLTATHIPSEDADHLALYSIKSGQNRSKIFKRLIKDFLESIPSSEELIKIISTDIIKDWEKTQIKNNNKKGWGTIDQLSSRWEEYKNELKTALMKKKIPNNIIKKIINNIEGKYDDKE